MNKSIIAQKQQEAQLKATEYDLDKILPELDKAILKLVQAVNTLTEEDLKAMSKKKLKDLTSALASLMEKRNAIVKPQQIQTSTRKRRRYRWKDDKGHQVDAEEVEEPAETLEA